jgi:hypothetical protein
LLENLVEHRFGIGAIVKTELTRFDGGNKGMTRDGTALSQEIVHEIPRMNNLAVSQRHQRVLLYDTVPYRRFVSHNSG